MKKMIFALLLTGFFSQAQAAFVEAAEGPDSFNLWGPVGEEFSWSVNHDGGDGKVEYDVTAETVRITGSDDQSEMPTNTEMTTTGAGIVDFNWIYSTTDTLFGVGFDPFIFIRDLLTDPVTFVDLTQEGLTDETAGVFTSRGNVILEVGALWGFSIDSFDSSFGAGIVTISDLSFAGAQPSPVPVPPAFLLFGTAMASLAYVRRKKQAAAV